MAEDDGKRSKLPDLDVLERVYGAAYRWWRGRTDKTAAPSASAVRLGSLENMLIPLARLLADTNLLIRTSEALGGVRGRVILLPSAIDVAESRDTNHELYVLRTTIAATQVRLDPAPSPERDPLRAELAAMQSAAQAVATLRLELEAFGPRYDAATALALAARPDPQTLSGRAAALETLRRQVAVGRAFDLASEAKRLARLPAKGPPSAPLLLLGGALSPTDAQAALDAAGEELEGKPADGTEFEAPPKDEIARKILQQQEDAEVAPLHLFEKIQTLDSFDGGSQRSDGDDELEEHLDALDEIDLRQIIRGGDDTHSILRADLDGLSEIPDVQRIEPGERGIPYDEWDSGSGRYREGWVTVYPSKVPAADPGWCLDRLQALAPLRRKLERRILAQRHSREHLTRQADGDDIDLPAIIEFYGNRMARRIGPERLYERRPRTRRDTATTVLLDTSLSVDSWVDGRRVLAVTRDAALLLGEVADRLGDQLQFLAFASHTRNRCRVWTVKDWHDSWALGRARLGTLRPQGYTRIGPAVRHATAGLSRMPQRHRLLLIVTDGKPTDFDRYEGRYGVADVSRAAREAHEQGIAVYVLGIDPRAVAALPAMFGVGNWSLLRNIGELPEQLVDAYGRATAL